MLSEVNYDNSEFELIKELHPAIPIELWLIKYFFLNYIINSLNNKSKF